MMWWKRVLNFSLLFVILAISLFFYVFPNILYPLRRDIVAVGAYVVPWMRPSPSIDELNVFWVDTPPWNIDDVMADALKLDMTFNISILNETHIVPSTVYLGHDSKYLYIGGKFRGIYRNPTNTSPTSAFPDVFARLFDVKNDGHLTFPEAGTLFGVALFENASWHTQAVWSYDDLLWWETRSYWCIGEDFYFPKAQPGFAVRITAKEYDNSTGTLIILFSRYLWNPSDSYVNAFQMRPGERWVMGFVVIVGYTNESTLFQSSMVAWPRDYSYTSNDSSWWPKLAVDLTNPPSNFENQVIP